MRVTLATLLSLIALAQTADYRTSVDQWRAQREAKLKAENGWLTVVDLAWLKDGDNHIPRIGVVTLKNGKAYFNKRELQPDTGGSPTTIFLGRLNFYIIEREGQLAVRVKDNDSPARRAFSGLKWYPIDASWRVRAKFVKWPQPKTIVFDTAVGVKEPMTSAGYVSFQRDGKEYRLEPVEEDAELFFVIRDATSGKSTYAASRFLYTALPRDGFVDLDFNKTENPPCVFTDFATCPLPPPANRLTLAVTAGEMMYQH